MVYPASQTLSKRRGLKKLVIDVVLTKLFFRHTQRSPIGTSALISMSDSSSSVSLSGSVFSAESPSHHSPFLSPLSFQPDEDFRLLVEMTSSDGAPLSIYLQHPTPKDPLDSYIHFLQPATSSASQMEPTHDDASFSSSPSHPTATLTSTLTSKSQSSSPKISAASIEIASGTNESTESYTPPPPLEHPCVETAKQMGIKIRDFAYEDHGVKTAPVVDEVDVLKAQYLKHRASGQKPPRETTDILRCVDSKWLEAQEQKFANDEPAN
ncbi:hypothetical protein BU17DRAFT_70369 [Hysterangium stoloniferum]|nr:hypothetical protein BU17DRAFT_70369 [Hysterangium stoloniferum]